MIKFFSSIITYLYICFKKGVKCDFPCKASPFFTFRKLKGIRGVDLGSAFVGRDVLISDGCHFYENPIVFGNVSIGRYCSINGPGTRICAGKNGVKIGAFCSIASNVIIQEYNHRTDSASSYNILSGVLHESDCDMSTSKGAIVIEEGVWIGSNSVVLSGVRIGRGAVIGAGSIVVQDVPSYSVVVGNPARVVKYRFSEQSIKEIESSKWWLWDEEKMSENKDFFKRHFE